MPSQKEMIKIFKSFKSIELHPKQRLFECKAKRFGYDDFNGLALKDQICTIHEAFKVYAIWFGELEARKMVTRVLYCLWDEKSINS